MEVAELSELRTVLQIVEVVAGGPSARRVYPRAISSPPKV